MSQLRLRREALHWREGGEETVVLDTEASLYLAANASASLLWAQLAEGATQEELVAALRERYGIAEETAERDVRAFIDDLAARGLLEA